MPQDLDSYIAAHLMSELVEIDDVTVPCIDAVSSRYIFTSDVDSKQEGITNK